MSESVQHTRLVQAIIAQLDTDLGPLCDIMVCDDSPNPLRGERPPKLSGFIPDVYATDVPTTRVVVGEAKTEQDLETTRSHLQITAFLTYLSAMRNSLFILAVPFCCIPRGNNLLQELTRTSDTPPLIRVIDDFGLEHG